MIPPVDLSDAAWFKSSYSNNGGTCVDVAPVRDSKDPQGPALVFPAESWASFVTAVQHGEFGEI